MVEIAVNRTAAKCFMRMAFSPVDSRNGGACPQYDGLSRNCCEKRRLTDSLGQALATTRTSSEGEGGGWQQVPCIHPSRRRCAPPQDELEWLKRPKYWREERMTSQQENSQIESSMDRRLFLGAAGALTLAGPSAAAQETKAEPKAAARPADAAKRLSD